MALAARSDQAAPADSAEDARLAALDRYDVLDTPGEAAFDRIANLMQLIFKVDTTIVSVVDGHRQWYKAASGGASAGDEVPLPDTFCQTTLAGNDVVVVPDALDDVRFKDNPHVTSGRVRFYAGIPLRTPDGFNIGTICAIDGEPRNFDKNQQDILSGLARIAMSELELRQLASVDTLTGISARRAFKEEAERLAARARRHRSRLCAISFDLDSFKAVNDTYGHATGDKVLVAVAAAVGGMLRQSDLFGRLGGEEFAILVPDADAASAYDLAEKLRGALRGLKFPGVFPMLSVSASFGIALFDPGSDSMDSLLVKADEALYEAKRKGRNRSIIWHEAGKAAGAGIERRRVLKAGRLIFNNKLSSIDCTVRSLSDSGADISVATTVGIPDRVTLQLKADGFEWACEVVERRPNSLEVAFR